MVDGLFEMQFAYEIQKLMSDRKIGYSPLQSHSWHMHMRK